MYIYIYVYTYLADSALRAREAALHRAGPVGGPLPEDGEDEVAEDALEDASKGAGSEKS